MVCPHNTACAPVNRTNKTGLKVGMNASREGFGMEASRHHQRIRKHPPIDVNPVVFITVSYTHMTLPTNGEV